MNRDNANAYGSSCTSTTTSTILSYGEWLKHSGSLILIRNNIILYSSLPLLVYAKLFLQNVSDI